MCHTCSVATLDVIINKSKLHRRTDYVHQTIVVTLSLWRNSRLLKPPQSCLVVGRMWDYAILYRLSDHDQWSKTRNILHTSVASLQVVSRPPRKGLVQLRTTSCVHAKILAWPIRFVDHLMNWCYPRHQTLPWGVGEAGSRWPAIVQGHVTWHWVWHAGYFHYSHTIDSVGLQ